MKNPISLTFTTLLLAGSSLSAATRYVSRVSAHPTPPYTDWATAAKSIQDAVGAAAAGDLVVVTDGVYAGEVEVNKPVALRSVNGPQVTIIDGGGSSPCASLNDGASVSGFTLTHGRGSAEGGGVICASTNAFLTNCVIQDNWAGWSFWGSGGGAVGGTLYNCTLVRNSAVAGIGGGACGSVLYNCTLAANGTGNFGAPCDYGGGAYQCTLYNCTLSNNFASTWGGGADNCTLYDCTLVGNTAGYGGGACASTLYNCTLNGNSADNGGGTAGGTLYNCALTGNSANTNFDGSGGGANGGTLYNCTLAGNSGLLGGGAYQCALYNCIVYFNTAVYGANYDDYSSTLNYCCTTPLPAKGVRNIALDPQLARAFHLSVDSPCRGAGSPSYATGMDIDGELWGSPPSIGCDEYHAGEMTGPLVVNWSADYRAVTPGYTVALTALIEGRTTASVWEFEDGEMVTNRPNVGHSWAQPGEYLVALRAFNESHPEGVTATGTVGVAVQPVLHVAVDSVNPSPPYFSWATAATNIQAAVDTTLAGAEILVTNGVYAGGVTVTNALTLLSVNGPQVTAIDGGGTKRCVYLTNEASLSGFTLTNGWAADDGGGVLCASRTAFLTNCTLTGNWAQWYGGGAAGASIDYYCTLYNCTLTNNRAELAGGGVYACMLHNCTLTGNSANYGGGADYSWLDNCTLTGNSALYGGGADGCGLYKCALISNSAHTNADGSGGYGGGAGGGTLYNCTLTGNSALGGGGAGRDGYDGRSTLYNCIVYYNTTANGADYAYSTLNYCCTMLLPTNGVGNITNAPLFVDYANGNLRLQSNSPCINAGNNAYWTTATDLDGKSRIVSGTLDIGAYEYQGTGSAISYAWLQQYGLPTDGTADYADPDHDGLNTWQEWICGTNPTNALSALRLLSPSMASTNVAVTWQSVAGVNYFLERSATLASPFTDVATNILGQAGTTIYADTNATGPGPFFYRVGVKSP